MTREEAIEYWEGLRKTFSSQLEKEENYFGRMHLQTTIDAIDMAIAALRQQEAVTNRNEPLTLDELRKMDGEPVWVQSPGVPEYGRWAIVEGVGENCLFLHDDFTCHDYGKTWLAYRQKPEEDDHDERKENENV